MVSAWRSDRVVRFCPVRASNGQFGASSFLESVRNRQHVGILVIVFFFLFSDFSLLEL